jgi:hypothetical protein
MARPKIITLEAGKISLIGFPKEVSEKLEAYILDFGKDADKPKVAREETIQIPVEGSAELLGVSKALMLGELTEKALAVHHDKINKRYDLVIVKYNPTTKEAAVDNIRAVGEYKQLATNEFKKKVIEFGFV